MLETDVLIQALLVALAALGTGHAWGMQYRQRGDRSAPGGTQAARALFWLVPVWTASTALAWLSMTPLLAVVVGAATGVLAFLGLLLLPHGGLHSLGRYYQSDKLDARILKSLGLFTEPVCVLLLGVYGAGRLALLVAPVPLTQGYLMGVAPDWWLFGICAFGVTHGIAYAIGDRRAPWDHPMLRGSTEVGEYLWGWGQGIAYGGGMALLATPALRWTVGLP